MDDIYPVNVRGTITLSDGSQTWFAVEPDLGWQQWGNNPSKLGATVDMMDALAQATDEYLREKEED